MATTVLNVASCDTSTQTGIFNCNIETRVPAYMIAVPKGYVIPTGGAPFESIEAFKTFFLAQFTADNPAERWHMTPLLTNFEDKTPEPTTEERNGTPYSTFYAAQQWSFLMNADYCSYQTWAAIVDRKKNWDFFVLDIDGNFFGQAALSLDENVDSMKGFTMAEVSMPYYKTATTAALNQYPIHFKFLDGNELARNKKVIQAGILPTSVNQPVNVTLSLALAAAIPVTIKGVVGCGNDLVQTYGDVLNVIGAWKMRNVTDDTDITITAVAVDTEQNQIEITASTGFADGDKIELSLKAPDALHTAVGLWLGSNTIKFTYTV